MRILSSKKGVEVISNWPFWIMFAIAMGVIGIAIATIGNISISEASRIPQDLEDELLLASRFYNSQQCFAYQDDIGRIHTQVINASKFTQENLNRCFPISDANYAFSLTLRVPALDAPPLHTFELGPIKTHRWSEGSETRGIVENVLVIHDGKIYEGKLTIQIKNVE